MALFGQHRQGGRLDVIKMDGIDNNTITIMLLTIDSNTIPRLAIR